MKQKRKFILIFLIAFLFLILLGYLLLAFYYREGFSLNTWINGVYCTGRTVEDVNSELLVQTEAPIVAITDLNGQEYSINLADAAYKIDYQTPLTQYLQNQNPFLWVDNITAHRTHTLSPTATFDEKILLGLWEKLPFVIEEQQKESILEIRHTEKGYQLYNGLENRLDLEKAYSILTEKITEGKTKLNLSEEQCYYQMDMSAKQEQIYSLWEKIEAFQNSGIIYDMGDNSDEKILLDASIMSEFLEAENGEVLLDEAGSLVLNQEKVSAFVEELAKKFDTYDKERSFLSTRGDLITIKGGTYGTKLNQKAEVDFLMENLLRNETQTRVPEYDKSGVARGKDDIGTTYIEIDMTEQKMYYYEEGELLLETDIVTGNTGRKMGTPEGAFYVYNKQKNRILRGPGYASPVKFWMPVKGSIGIHDANWRSKFGGEIYKTGGSHGCINTPTEKMTELYDMVEIGTPVMIFY